MSTLATAWLAVCQVAATVHLSTTEPVRVGLPVPITVDSRGLRASGDCKVQWRLLTPARDGAAYRWIEVWLQGRPGRVKVSLGGACASDTGPVVACTVQGGAEGDALMRRWEFSNGAVLERDLSLVTEVIEGESWRVGERRVEPWPVDSWAGSARVDPAVWQRAGIVPDPGRRGRLLRRHLVHEMVRLPEMPGERGRGDYVRGGDESPVVTNLEYDTALALLRLGLVEGSPALIQRAHRAAWHMVTRDLDPRSGLPFPHGRDHRSGQPEPGHAWLRGLLLVGLVTADRDLLDGASSMARSLARTPPRAEAGDVDERARDLAWPLWELEGWLQVFDDPVVERAADALGDALLGRFDRELGVFRFGEGEPQDERRGANTYFERAWITGGIVLPALAAHAARRGHPDSVRAVEQAREQLLSVILSGGQGLPLHYRVTPDGGHFAASWRRERGEGYMLLEGLDPVRRDRCLRRKTLADGLGLLPLAGDPQAATVFTMVARNEWVLGW